MLRLFAAFYLAKNTMKSVITSRERCQRDGEDEGEDEYGSAGNGAVPRVAELQLKCEFSLEQIQVKAKLAM